MYNNTKLFRENNMNTAKFASLLAVLALSISCGEAIDINRVAPNAIKKTQFDGEWYYRETIVDKQFHSDSVFIGLEGGLDRIKWEVTESQLVGRRSYERVPGSDPTNPGEQNVIITFPIRSHFDIRRQYNPVNGVESNVIEENTYDRPWFERDYMRVDWGAASTQASSLLQVQGGGNGLNRESNETANFPWKTRLSDDYMETTIDGFTAADPWVCYYLDGLSPCNGANVKVKLSFRRVPTDNDYQELDYPDYIENTVGTLVDASNGQAILTSTSNDVGAAGPFARICSPNEMGRNGTVTVKVAFDGPPQGVGAPPSPRMCNTDPTFGDDLSQCADLVARCDVEGADNLIGFTPGGSAQCDPNTMSPDDCLELTTSVFSRFGYFRTDRFQIDRENGSQYNSRERLINRHNIWAKSVADDGTVLPNGQRPVKPIVYFLNIGFPTDLIETATVDLADDWNVAFVNAVAAARNVKPSELPKNLNELHPDFPAVERMFEVRVNDCNIDSVNAYAKKHGMNDALRANNIPAVAYGNLEEACAVLESESLARKAKGEDLDVFTWQQLGDLRFSFLNWTAKAELAGPLGYGPSAADPITGEIVSANANIYGASIDTYANWGADVVQLLNGDLSQADIINGTASREHVEGVRARWAQKQPAAKVDAFVSLFDSRASRMSDEQYYQRIPVTAMNRGLDRLRDSGIEEEFLLTSETLRLFGQDPEAQRQGRVTNRMLENARPSNWARERVPAEMLVAANAGASARSVREAGFMPTERNLSMAGRLDELSDYLGRKNFCFLSAQVEPAIADLAAKIAADGLSREDTVKFIRANVFRGVTAHELGHTFGLRHNFEGSADPINFFPEYYGVTAEGLDEDQQHLLSKSPRAVEAQYSTIMDYHQRFNSDFAGIGMYDKAAIKLGYAETVEVFDESEGAFVAREWMGNTFLLSPLDYPKLVGGPQNDLLISRLFDDAYEAASLGDENALLDIAGSPTTPAVAANLYKRRDIPLKDWFRNELINGFSAGLDDNDCRDVDASVANQPGCMDFILASNGLVDDDGHAPKVTVPYSFCGDEFAFGGNLTCNRWDLGATSSEIVKNAGELYEFYYPFDAFRRDRVQNPFGSWAAGYMNRLYSRTYQPMLNAYRYFYFYRRAQTLRVYPTIRDWGSAALQGMDFFVRVLQQPEPGTYCRDAGANAGDPADDTFVPQATAGAGTDCTDTVEVGLDQGRFFNTTWDNEYDFRPQSLGNYWDKALALQAITSSDAFFFRDFSQETNRGAFSIGYYRIFQNEMLDLFGAVMREDTSIFSPRVVATADGGAEVKYQPFLTTGIYGEELPPPVVVGDAIRPATSFQLRSYAAIFGTFNMTSTLDQTLDFSQRTRITLAGQAGDPELNLDRDGDGTPDLDVVEFKDPVSNMVYRSASYDEVDHAIGYRLVQEADDFAKGEWAAKKAALDAAVGADAIRAARVEFDRANNKLNEKVQLIDFMVYLGDMSEYPGAGG